MGWNRGTRFLNVHVSTPLIDHPEIILITLCSKDAHANVIAHALNVRRYQLGGDRNPSGHENAVIVGALRPFKALCWTLVWAHWWSGVSAKPQARQSKTGWRTVVRWRHLMDRNRVFPRIFKRFWWRLQTCLMRLLSPPFLPEALTSVCSQVCTFF